MIGKEFRNNQTDTWVNYAMPLTTKAEVIIKGEKKTFTLAEFVDLAIHDKWVKSDPRAEGRPDQEPASPHGHHLRPESGRSNAAVHRGDRSRAPRPSKAGLKPDDLVIYLDGEPVYSTDVFRDLLKRYQPGDKVQVEIRRGDVLTAMHLELAPLPKTVDSFSNQDLIEVDMSDAIGLTAFELQCIRTSTPCSATHFPPCSSFAAGAFAQDVNDATEKAMKAAAAKVAPSIVRIETTGGAEAIWGSGRKGPEVMFRRGDRRHHRARRRSERLHHHQHVQLRRQADRHLRHRARASRDVVAKVVGTDRRAC